MEQQTSLKKEKKEDSGNRATFYPESPMNNSKGIKVGDKNNSKNKKEEIEKNLRFDKNNSNIIFIGSKPLVNYIRGVITQFIKKESPEVIIKSRGKFISKAVDVAEVAKRSLADKNIIIKSINISSESFETEGKRTNISTMGIVLSRD